MKGVLAAKMSAMRKRSALSSSAANSESATTRDGATGIPNEPTIHHGRMRVHTDDSNSFLDAIENSVDIVLCIALDSVHVVVDVDNTLIFEAVYSAMKEIAWDHTECSLRFILQDGSASPPFIFPSALVTVEVQITTNIRSLDLEKPPDQVYVGVLVGRNVPTSPINQRRASAVNPSHLPSSSLPAAKRRELLAHERPPRNITSRAKLGMEYFKTGVLVLSCSINGDPRGLKLDSSNLFVYPSPDCFDRSACLFSYLYEQIEACEVRSGTRLELRFHRSGAKQPTFIAFHAPDAQYIRDAIWYFRFGVFIDVYYRNRLTNVPVSGPIDQGLQPASVSRRRSSLKGFRDDAALQARIESRCFAIGCTRRCANLVSADVYSSGPNKGRAVWFCNEHTAKDSAVPGSPPRSPSKRTGLLSRGKSSALLTPMIHSRHYIHSLRYHGMLLKSGGKYQLTKAWNQKIVALVESPVGSFLCYYDKLSHCPGLSDAVPRERRVIDLSSVVCVRRESLMANDSIPFAFDVVTVYRTWTFSAHDLQEYEIWLQVLRDAIEKHGSMAPDRPLRYPVKCLRDPLQNLPSKSDGSTSLLVSSNGVTVCSGTDGESEVYSWYFTEIQKWSVARQHDSSLCCFLSCICPLVPTSPSTAQDTASRQYQDFLFQTSEAESICKAIEFFVAKCMAKLEILGLVYSDSVSCSSSRRPSADASSIHALSKKTSSVPLKEFTPTPVLLRPVEIPRTVTDFDHQRPRHTRETESTQASPHATAQCDTTAIVSSAESRDLSSHIGHTESSIIGGTPPPPSVSETSVDVIASENDQTIQSQGEGEQKGAAVSPAVDSTTGEESDANNRLGDGDYGGTSGAAVVDTVGTHDNREGEFQETPEPPEHCDSAPIYDIFDLTMTDMLRRDDPTENDRTECAKPIEPDVDGDRFESFEYCECVVGSASSPDGDGELYDDSEYEDAQAGAYDGVELSTVVIDGCLGSDEESLVMLEEEQLEIDGVEPLKPAIDPVDELDAQYDESSAVSCTGGQAQDFMKVAIPVYTKREWCVRVEMETPEYDESMERAVVYTVWFRKGRRIVK